MSRFGGGAVVITRRQKLIAAAVVLAIGFGLAWPLRRGDKLAPRPEAIANLSATQSSPPRIIGAQLQASATGQPTSMAATTVSSSATRDKNLETPMNPITFVASGAAKQAADLTPTAPTAPTERVHIVHPGDSLERLADRYLGDEGRALEIFQLNRGVLENPHLLPLGAELRLPAKQAAVPRDTSVSPTAGQP